MNPTEFVYYDWWYKLANHVVNALPHGCRPVKAARGNVARIRRPCDAPDRPLVALFEHSLATPATALFCCAVLTPQADGLVLATGCKCGA